MQEYCSGLPFPSLGDLLDPEIETASLASPSVAAGFFIASAAWEGNACQITILL